LPRVNPLAGVRTLIRSPAPRRARFAIGYGALSSPDIIAGIALCAPPGIPRQVRQTGCKP
jgi:hypothetical protein